MKDFLGKGMSERKADRSGGLAERVFVFFSLFVIVGFVFSALVPKAWAAVVVIDDFEDVSDWSGLTAEQTTVQQGTGAGGWLDTVAVTSVGKDFSPPLDLSGVTHFGVWIHSAVANGARIQIIFNSENSASSGADYYRYELVVDWTGWKWLWLSKAAFGAVRQPVGWHEINEVRLYASGWNTTPLPDTALVLDEMIWSEAVVTALHTEEDWQSTDFVYIYRLNLEEPDGVATSVTVTCDVPAALNCTVTPAVVNLSPTGTDTVEVTVTIPQGVWSGAAYQMHPVEMVVETDQGGFEVFDEFVANPAEASAPPRTFLNTADITRINDWAAMYPWAETRRERIIDRADGWPQSFLDKYGLSAVALPPEGGQWSMHYVCPVHGVNLVYEPPMTHRCPIDNDTFSGWPYDQVIYGRQHNDLARAARDLGLAYALTGEVSYAEAARQILMDYAAAYLTYPLHDTSGGASASGARVLAQTLDESGWLISIAWAYDLIGASGVLSATDRDAIEANLLRASAFTIKRHDSGKSNWQAWHNAAMAAAGRALEDPRWVAHALWGKSGFHFHMAESVLTDGFWFEGSWGYHFYTLSPMTYLAELGERGGFSLYPNPALRSMYSAPIQFAPPDLVLPAFNDSSSVDLTRSAGWRLEAAYKAYGDPLYAVCLVGENRGENALFWGAETLPQQAQPVEQSLVFEASGYAVVRGGVSGDPWYLALDFGPHGGWHGHFDKLGYVFYARGKTFALDPGSHSYALDLHDTWDRSTVAHNTVVVDESDQQEATGALLRFNDTPLGSWVRAAAGPVYENISLVRDMVMLDGYLLERTTGESTDTADHLYDWFYHTPAQVSTELSLSPYASFGGGGGYAHLSNNQGVTQNEDAVFTMAFDAQPTYPEGFWPSDSEIVAESLYSDVQSHGGDWSHELQYDFSSATVDAYVNFNVKVPDDLPAEVPTHLAVWVYGQSSQNSFRLRVIDTTGESHVSPSAVLDFDGWQAVEYEITEWSHWGGNEDGIIDLPVDHLVFQLNREDGGELQGSVFVDDWMLTVANAGQMVVEDYERMVALNRLWIKGAADTDYVVGEGIGPDLTVPVPYLLARRQGQGAVFHVLHEPHGEAGPAITGFEVLSSDAPADLDAVGYRILRTVGGQQMRDIVVLMPEATEPTASYSFEETTTDGVFVWVRLDTGGQPQKLLLCNGTALTQGGQSLFSHVESVQNVSFHIHDGLVEILSLDGSLENGRLLAPQTTDVLFGGNSVSFHMDGDYVVFGEVASNGDGGVGPDGATDGGVSDDGGNDGGASPSGSDSGCGCRVFAAKESKTSGLLVFPLNGILLLVGFFLWGRRGRKKLKNKDRVV
jgi:hypothetical protein